MKFYLIYLFICCFLGNIAAQRSYLVNGYYLTLEGDTILGHLENRKDKYLICRDSTGDKKLFTPSKIRGFHLDETDYKSAFMPDLKMYRFLKIIESGDVFLFQSSDQDFYMNNSSHIVPATYSGAGKTGISVTVPLRKPKTQIVYSGLYIQRENDSIMLSVPARKESLYLFMQEHFNDNNTLVQEFIDHSSGINDFGRFVFKYNSLKNP